MATTAPVEEPLLEAKHVSDAPAVSNPNSGQEECASEEVACDETQVSAPQPSGPPLAKIGLLRAIQPDTNLRTNENVENEEREDEFDIVSL